MENKSKFDRVKKENENWKWLQAYSEEINHLKSYTAFFRFCSEIDFTVIDINLLSELDMLHLDLAYDVTERVEFVISTTAKGKFIRSLPDREIAIFALNAFSNGVDKNTEGVIHALLFKKGLKRDILTEKSKFDDLLRTSRSDNKNFIKECSELKEWLDEELRKSKQATIELEDQCRSLVAESEKQKKAVLDIEEIKNNLDSTLKLELQSKIENAGNSYSQSLQTMAQDLKREEKLAKQRFESFADAYQNQMKLKAPVQYWTDNCTHHRQSAKKFGIASILLSIVIFLPIAYVAWEILANEEIVWGKVGVVGFTTSLAIWLIRVLVRMYLSHNHMQMNSQERVVMTQAYLALISEGGASSSEERNLVLQAIFRPISTGIVTDDAAPNNIIELISKARK